MELRYQMTDILPLLPIPQPPNGKSAYNIPCPLCDRAGSREKHLNINLKRNVYRCPKCGTIPGWCLRSLCLLHGIPREKVLEDLTARLQRDISYPAGKAATRKKLQPPPMKPQASLAPLEERDRVYRALLNRLTLAPDHRENLLSRGLTDEAIDGWAIVYACCGVPCTGPVLAGRGIYAVWRPWILSGQGWAMDNGCVA